MGAFMTVVQLIFLILGLLIVLTGIFPTPSRWTEGPVVTPQRALGIVLALVLLFLIYLVFAALFGQGPVVSRG
jgi:hypothetical protein